MDDAKTTEAEALPAALQNLLDAMTSRTGLPRGFVETGVPETLRGRLRAAFSRGQLVELAAPLAMWQGRGRE